ncbi:hypothetical protein GOFOIKOB_6171 [Methylobacterium tardum]|uniref:Uncharacterized protein n=1 Tax=Methylobacterium tardum TaxID=374432 RepID=A0AA37T8E3_9HYPH|nr:hypothetical protein [Methylobacterium tardum]URD38776.1 hypothetical protein M6G65_10350 [Methylobacterium tardum]GJE53095.1 hypothetical protein GOFOIKOB_6171 [Methylobacterium tardum]GLS68699.1 hypothetical protein GCM10007890_07110 [Methylobacterium tardum]
MKFKIWKRARAVECGVRIFPNGLEIPIAYDDYFFSAFKLPVLWKGEEAVMHFNYGTKRLDDINIIATRLLAHPRLAIGGQVEIITHVERRFKMRVWAREEYVRDAIANLQFDVPPRFGRSSWGTVNIYADTPSDLVAIRMCI